MRLIPLFDRVLLDRPKLEKVGSIIIPDDASKRAATTKCTVLAVGANVDPCIKPGMTVLIGMYAGTWLNADGRAVPKPDDAEFYVVADVDIICEVAE